MAFGLTPKHVEELSLDKLTPQQFLVIAVDIAKDLEWDIRYLSEKGLIAFSTAKRFKWKAKITIRINDDRVNVRSESTGNEMIDMGRNKKTVDLFLNAFYDVRYTFSAEALAPKYEELAPTLVHPGQDILSLPPATSKENAMGFFSLFVPKKKYFITPILVDLNIGVFILMVIMGVNAMQPDNLSLIDWGANFRPVTLEGEWWRLVTNFFLHIGIVHLLCNMFALVYVGLLLEPYLGKTRFAVAYMLTGIIASLTSLSLHENTISAGASGAIFGMYGVFLAMLSTNLIEKATRKALLTSIGIFVIYNLAYGMKGGIDNAAHVGGLISGCMIGYLFYPGLKKPENKGLLYSSAGIAVLCVLAISFVAYHRIPNDIALYEKKMKLFARTELRALRVYKMPANSTKNDLLVFIRDSGITYWKEDIKVLQEAQKLKIPEQLQSRLGILMDYCNVRIDNYNYLYGLLKDDSGEKADSMSYYNSRITALIDSLKAN